MNLPGMLLMALAAMAVASCTGNNPPTQDHPSSAINRQGPGDGAPVATAPKGNRAAQSSAGSDNVPPPDAQYTLFCEVIRGPAHVPQALEIVKQLQSQTHRTGWHTLHEEESSTIYFGYYRTFDDALNDSKETSRAQADRRMLENLRDPLGNREFPNSMFVPVNAPDPKAPADWNLANAPADMYWSLQVAAYQGSPDRKQFAVDGVAKLREKGVKAFYFHGESISSVCIGLWPRSAVREQSTRDDAHTIDPTQPLLVFNDVLPPGMSPDVYRDGQRVQVEAPKLEIQDPSLAQTIKDYPAHAVNGVYRARSGGGVSIPDPSFLVQVPHRPGAESTNQAASPGQQNPGDAAANAILDQQPPVQQPGYGKLRSIGDQ